MPPTRVVEDYIEEFEVDGVRMIFQNTPGTEAPSEMNTYLPDKKALWMAENVSNTIHNVYQVPKSLEDSRYARGYHGSPEHNSRSVLNRFLGYWDASPTTLIPLSRKTSHRFSSR